MNNRQQVGLFFALFFTFLVVGGREPPWTDARQIYLVAENLVARGEISVDVRTGVERDGKFYAAHPFLASAIHIPGAALVKASHKLWPGSTELVRPLGSHLGPAALAALAGLLFFRLCLALGSSVAGARFGTVTVTFATMVAVYARSPYSEILQTAVYLWFFLAFVRWLDRPTLARAAGFGVAAGALVNTKVIFILVLPGAVALALWRLWRQPDRVKRVGAHAGMAALGGVPGVVMLFGYNYARTGTFLQTGYATSEIGGRAFEELTFLGLWGLFFSLGKSVFLYSPPLVAALFALRHALVTRPRLWAAALLATAGPVIVFYGRFTFWHGDWCWGPRYILFAVPPALLPLVFAYDDLRIDRRALALWGARLVFVTGLAVQILGAAFYWDHYIRLAREIQSQWLGSARRQGAITPDTGADCGPCMEDMYGLNWLPAFQPIEGHAWLLRHRARKDAWEAAESDAPWRRYTTLTFAGAHQYGRARLDWWMLDWQSKNPRVGVGLLAFFVLGAAATTALALHQRRERVDTTAAANKIGARCTEV